MLKHTLLLVVLVCVSVSAVWAQEDEPRREIYTVLELGDDVFEIGVWRAQASEEVDRTTATWYSEELGAVAFADYLHFDGGGVDLETFFDEEWFEVTFENYDSWELTSQCEVDDDLQLRVFNVIDEEIAYTMNYWVRVESETRVLAFFIVLPQENVRHMATYSERFEPRAVSCEAE
jgi:hypothetical protein